MVGEVGVGERGLASGGCGGGEGASIAPLLWCNILCRTASSNRINLKMNEYET